MDMNRSVFDTGHQQEHLDSKIVAGLERIAEAFRVALWDKSKVVKISPIQIQILIFLQYHSVEKCRITYLAKEFNLSKPTLSDAVKVLSRKGYISKLPDPDDARSIILQLTESGESVLEQVADYANPLSDAMEQWNSDQRVEFYRNLLNLIGHLHDVGLIHIQRMCMQCRYFDSSDNGQPNFCRFFQRPLKDENLRIDCPEFDANDP
jgi:DNA-binding MarR family transcriptional regulator